MPLTQVTCSGLLLLHLFLTMIAQQFFFLFVIVAFAVTFEDAIPVTTAPTVTVRMVRQTVDVFGRAVCLC